MKKMNLIILVLTILLSVVITGCKKNKEDELEKYTKQIKSSMNSVVKIDTTATVKDQDTVVYIYNKVLTLEGNNGNLTTAVSQLNSSFELVEASETNAIENINRNELISFNISKKLMSTYTYENSVLTCEVEKTNIASVLGVDNFNILDKATIVFTFEDKKIMNISCTFQTESTKDVVISAIYSY